MEIDSEVTQDEFDNELSKADKYAAEGANPWPAMTYIQGVRDALNWIQNGEESPLSELPF